jgi:CheY-like chemotaxis protein
MPGRIGVVVAGDVYANRSLVRPFLEDDGYRVDAEVFDGADLLPAVSGAMPDALLVDASLLAGRPHALEDIRIVSPETKVVVIGASAGNGSSGADAYLASGVSLATMSLTIGRILGDRGLGPTDDRSETRSSGGLVRFIATVALPIAAVWTLIVAVTPDGVAPPAADTTDLAETVISTTPQGEDRLDEAYAALDRLIAAIRSGNPVMATLRAQALMQAREGALATGFVVAGLDHAITSRLEAVAGLLGAAAIADLAAVLGALFPELPDEQAPGGGSGVILGPVTASGGGGGLPGSGGGGTDGGSPSRGPDVVSGPIPGGPIVGVALGPGDGRAWGQSHKADHALEKAAKEAAKETAKDDRKDASSERSHGVGPPPWANPNGHDAGSRGTRHGHDRVHGHGHGHGKA